MGIMTIDKQIIQADNEIKKKLRRRITDYLCKYATYLQLKEIAVMLEITE